MSQGQQGDKQCEAQPFTGGRWRAIVPRLSLQSTSTVRASLTPLVFQASTVYATVIRVFMCHVPNQAAAPISSSTISSPVHEQHQPTRPILPLPALAYLRKGEIPRLGLGESAPPGPCTG